MTELTTKKCPDLLMMISPVSFEYENIFASDKPTDKVSLKIKKNFYLKFKASYFWHFIEKCFGNFSQGQSFCGYG